MFVLLGGPSLVAHEGAVGGGVGQCPHDVCSSALRQAGPEVATAREGSREAALVPVTSVLLAAEQSGDLRVGARCARHDLVKCADPLTDLRREPGQHCELLPGV